CNRHISDIFCSETLVSCLHFSPLLAPVTVPRRHCILFPMERQMKSVCLIVIYFLCTLQRMNANQLPKEHRRPLSEKFGGSLVPYSMAPRAQLSAAWKT